MKYSEEEIGEAIREFAAAEEARAAEEIELPVDFTTQVLARIRRSESVRRKSETCRYVVRFPNLGLTCTAAVVLVAAFLLFFMSVSRPVTLAMVNPPNKGGTPPMISPWLNDSVAVVVNWKDSSLTLSLKDGGALTGKLSPSEGPPGAPALPYQFDLSVRGRSGTGAEIIGLGQLLVMPNDSATTRSKLKPATILWAKLNLKLQAGGQEDPVYRVFGTP